MLENYQRIANVCLELVSSEWKEIVLFCEADDDLIQFDSYIVTPSGSEEHFPIDGRLSDIFDFIRKSMPEGNEPFKQATFKLSTDGKFKIDYGYEPLPWE